MSSKDSLGDRMKMYETVPKTNLMKRVPVIIRIDGKAFHTFTRGFAKPFDEVLVETMQETTQYLCENIQGCVFGYTQSDEISLVLCDYQTYDTAAWFDYEVQKLCSIASSMATMAFNRIFADKVEIEEYNSSYLHIDEKVHDAHERAAATGALFDARCFNVPVEEVVNCILWRQQDATRNSIQMVAQSVFSHKELQGKNCNQLQDMLHEQKGINWNNCLTHLKRGTAVYKKDTEVFVPKIDSVVTRKEFVIDKEMPILSQDRNYLEQHIRFE